MSSHIWGGMYVWSGVEVTSTPVYKKDSIVTDDYIMQAYEQIIKREQNRLYKDVLCSKGYGWLVHVQIRKIWISRKKMLTHQTQCIKKRKRAGSTRSSLPTDQRRRNITIPGITALWENRRQGQITSLLLCLKPHKILFHQRYLFSK